MRCIAVIGARGQGKTTFSRRLVASILKAAKKAGAPLSALIYDPTGQWGVPFERWESFERRVIAARSAVVVVEEATVKLDNRHYSAELQEALIASRHARVTYVLQFHSVRSVPSYIMALLDTVYLFRTSDNPGDIERSYARWPELLDGWKRAQELPRYTPARVDLHR